MILGTLGVYARWLERAGSGRIDEPLPGGWIETDVVGGAIRQQLGSSKGGQQ